MIFDSTNLADYTLVLVAFAAAFAAALWLSLIIWTARDIGRRSQDGFARFLAVLVVTLLFIPGWFLYMILRPSTTLEEEYQRTLEEEALLQNIEDIVNCPGCNRRTQPDWKVCPDCYTLLKKSCHNCGKLMELPWNLCPFCGTPVPGVRIDTLSGEESSANTPDRSKIPDSGGRTPSTQDDGWVFFPHKRPEEPESHSTSPES